MIDFIMSHILDPLPPDISDRISCHYANKTGSLQIVRIQNISNWYFERVVFPEQTLMFYAVPEALLEVYSCEIATALLVERIPCVHLVLTESNDIPFVPIRKQGKIEIKKAA
ncbi:MAG: DUF1830 domain-containing protein [Cyanobacteria bacterium P01_D01_bin.56]